MLKFFVSLVFVCYQPLVGSTGLKEEFTWSRITFDAPQFKFKSESDDEVVLVFPQGGTGNVSVIENEADDSKFIFENNVPMGANRWKDKLFITVPRRKRGVFSTLNYVPMNSTERHNVPLIPYPDLKSNNLTNSQGFKPLISVYRTAVDLCDRLWMVDTGIVGTLDKPIKLGPQRVVIIDLNTDRIIKTHSFKETDLEPQSALAMTTIDVIADDQCEDAYAYFPDLAGFGLVVYSLKTDQSWRVRHNFFYLEPQAGEFRIGGLDFQWNDGIFSGALTAVKNATGYRDFIFHAMAGTHLYSVSTEILRNKTLATRSYHGDDFKILGDRGPKSQTSASDLHKSSGILFLSLVNQNAVGCWNTNKGFDVANFGLVQKNDTTMIYPSDLKIYRDEIIVLTNSMPIFLYRGLNYEETNFRVWMNRVDEAVNGTICDIEWI